MALIRKLLLEKDTLQNKTEEGVFLHDLKCENPRCITSTEQELAHIFRVVSPENRICRCLYCDMKKKY